MKRSLSVLLAILIMFCALPLSAQAVDNRTQADTVAGTSYYPITVSCVYDPASNTATVEWSEIAGASGFMIQLLNSFADGSNYSRISKSEVSVSHQRKVMFGAESFSEYGWGGDKYYVEVVAYGDDLNTVIASGRSNIFTTELPILDEPQEVKLDKNGVASWKRSSQADLCRLYLYQLSDDDPLLVIGVEGESYDLSSYMVSGCYYYIRVRCEASGYRFSNLIMSESVAFMKQSVSGIFWSDYQLSWSAYSGAAQYQLILYIREPNTKVIGKVTSDLSYDFTDILNDVYRQYGTVSCYVKVTALRADTSALSLPTDSPSIRTGKLIDIAGCTISAPVGREHPDFDPVPLDGSKYYAEVIDWYLYEGSYPHLTASDVFSQGKRYAVRIRFTAKDGYRLQDNETTYTINGSHAVSVGKHTREFVMTASQGGTLITSAGCLITAPIAGQKPATDAVSLDSGKYEAQLKYWYLNESPYPHLSSGDTFEAGKKYAVRVEFVAKDGYRLDNDKTEFTINGKSPRTIGNNIRELEMTAADGIAVKTVDCTLTAPRVGDHPDMHAVAADDEKYTASVDKWYLDTAPDYPQLTENGYFRKDNRYAVRVDYIPKEGYCFDETTVVKIGGNDAIRVGIHTWEYVFDVMYADISLSGTCESYIDNYTAVILLFKEGETKASYHTYQNAKIFQYNIPDIEPGVYTVKVSKRDHVAREYTVDIHGSTQLDVKICPIGDATMDGNVNMFDYNAIYKHVAKTSELEEGSYQKACADATGDGKVNMFDYNAIYKHVAKTKPLF